MQEVIKGWYVPSRQDEVKGESTAWYASFWRFCAAYLKERFATRWCLSPEQSLSLHAGNWTVPRQLVVRSPGAGNKVTKLRYDTSLLELRIAMPAAPHQEGKDGLRLFTVESALIECSPNYFSNNSTDVRAVLPMIRDASGLLARLLEGSHTVIAGRLAGAFRNIGRDRLADDIVKTMSAADYDVRETDPFTDKPSLVFRTRETSPYVNRIRLLWQKMREPVIDRFPKEPGIPRNIETYMKRVNDAYVTDAYHSLSIEGYRVTPELIERVRNSTWNADANKGDASSGTQWRRAATGRPIRPYRKASAGFCMARMLARLRTRITGLGTANCSRRAPPSACWHAPTLPAIATARFISGSPCMCRRTTRR